MAGLVDPVVVGAGHDLHLPHPLSLERRATVLPHPPAGRAGTVAQRQALPRLERMTVEPADPGLVKGRARAQHRRRVDTARDGEIGTGAQAREAERQHLAGTDGKTFPERRRRVVQCGLHVGAGDGDDGVPAETQRRAGELAFEPGRALGVADQQVGEAEGPVVHRARERKPLLPVADTPRIVLHRGLKTGLDHLKHGRCPDRRERRFGRPRSLPSWPDSFRPSMRPPTNRRS